MMRSSTVIPPLCRLSKSAAGQRAGSYGPRHWPWRERCGRGLANGAHAWRVLLLARGRLAQSLVLSSYLLHHCGLQAVFRYVPFFNGLLVPAFGFIGLRFHRVALPNIFGRFGWCRILKCQGRSGFKGARGATPSSTLGNIFGRW